MIQRLKNWFKKKFTKTIIRSEIPPMGFQYTEVRFYNKRKNVAVLKCPGTFDGNFDSIGLDEWKAKKCFYEIEKEMDGIGGNLY